MLMLMMLMMLIMLMMTMKSCLYVVVPGCHQFRNTPLYLLIHSKFIDIYILSIFNIFCLMHISSCKCSGCNSFHINLIHMYMSKLQGIHTFNKYDIYIYIHIYIHTHAYMHHFTNVPTVSSNDGSHQHQELLPSWSRPWARLGMAAEGMEDGLGIWKNPWTSWGGWIIGG